jgi:hypothetical protein
LFDPPCVLPFASFGRVVVRRSLAAQPAALRGSAKSGAGVALSRWCLYLRQCTLRSASVLPFSEFIAQNYRAFFELTRPKIRYILYI